MIESKDKDYSKFYDSNSNIHTSKRNNKSQLFNTSTEPIYNNSNHYFCTKCLKFPFIKFCKDRRNIRLTCCCFNNKKILIEDLFSFENKYNLLIKNSNFFTTKVKSNKIIKKIINNNFLCKADKKKFESFSIDYMENYCPSCIKYESDSTIYFNDIKIEKGKILQLLEKIYEHNDYNSDSINDIKFIKTNDSNYRTLSEDEDNRFKQLINIILNDYKEYPNFSHFLNVKNLLHFFKIENNSEIKEEEVKINNILINNIEPVIIEYINNNSKKIKLFSKIFVKNNKKNFKIETEGQVIDLIDEYEFKRKDKKVRIKLLINNGVSEINMNKMFSNCINLIYVDGISKLNKIKIININKLFYNCINLSSIPDLNEFEIQKHNPYLIFYNCISLIFLPNEQDLNINKYDGIIITKYLNLNKEIAIGNIIEDNEGYINLFRNKFKIDNKELMIFNGNDENELIVCYKDEKKGDGDELNLLYKNDENSTKLKIRIINKKKDMNRIIIKNELDLSKWNTNNVTNMESLFSNCKSLSSLPDISKWNVNNVTTLENLCMGCESLSSLPDISKWNTNKIVSMTNLFSFCTNLSSLPDISKWNTNNVTNMDNIFTFCTNLSSLPDISKWNTNKIISMNNIFTFSTNLSSLPDISKWNTNNVTNMEHLFNNCTSLSSLPDISKWNTNKIVSMNGLFSFCTNLTSLPDIYKWNINNLTNMNNLFNNCTSLSSLPDISKWNTINVTNMDNLITFCISLSSLPDIYKWNTNNVTSMKNLFSFIKSLTSLPDISKWNINNVTNMESLFSNCSSLLSLPDISKWNTNNVTSMKNLFSNCSSLLSLPDISKWNTNNVTNNGEFI